MAACDVSKQVPYICMAGRIYYGHTYVYRQYIYCLHICDVATVIESVRAATNVALQETHSHTSIEHSFVSPSNFTMFLLAFLSVVSRHLTLETGPMSNNEITQQRFLGGLSCTSAAHVNAICMQTNAQL